MKEQLSTNKVDIIDTEKDAAYAEMLTILDKFKHISETNNMANWFRPMAKEFLTLRKQKEKLHPAVASFLDEVGPFILECFRAEAKSQPVGEKDKNMDVLVAIKNFAKPIQPEAGKEMLKYEVVPFYKLIDDPRLSIEQRGEDYVLRIQVGDGTTKEVLMPESGVVYKGGVARMVAKIFLKASMEGETNTTDNDIIVSKDKGKIDLIAERYETTPVNVEVVSDMNYGSILATRDTDMNAVLLTRLGLLLTDEAKRACQTRIIHPLLPKERPLFGKSTFCVDGIDLARNALIYRLVRMVVDNKADAFEIKRGETQVELGIYWLILAKNYLNKDNRVESLGRLYEIAKEMDQVGTSSTPMEWLDTLHKEYPDFDFGRGELSGEEYVRWLFGKFLKLVGTKYKQKIKYYDKQIGLKNPEIAMQLVRVPEKGIQNYGLTEVEIEKFVNSRT